MTETAKKLPNKWQERLNNEDNPEINEPISKLHAKSACMNKNTRIHLDKWNGKTSKKSKTRLNKEKKSAEMNGNLPKY